MLFPLQPVVAELLHALHLGPSSVLLDIGCGDGRVAIAAARDHGVARAIGVEALSHVYDKAVAGRDDANLTQQQVELHCTNFAQSGGNAVLEDCLDRQFLSVLLQTLCFFLRYPTSN